SLNGIVDAARVHEGEWRNIRGAQPPKRNTFSNANRHREAAMAGRLYWEVFEHLVSVCPGFGQYKRHKGFLARMKRGIFAIDSSTIKLCLNCIDWARHRRKKAAAKLHMNLDVGSRLPAFAVVEDAGHHDSTQAQTLCAGLTAGDVCLADRAYTDFSFLDDLRARGVFFVVRQKANMRLQCVRRLPQSRNPRFQDAADTSRFARDPPRHARRGHPGSTHHVAATCTSHPGIRPPAGSLPMGGARSRKTAQPRSGYRLAIRPSRRTRGRMPPAVHRGS
ncbi:MAG: IS4 family transposase, partial [Lentisphaerae bacterium]|nr:IS4 family transposase [Lentisphaerota bacterium]